MYKLFGLWSAPRPEDRADFEAYYARTHLPRACAVPHLVSVITTLVDEGLAGENAAAYRIAEMVFADRAGYEASTRSPEWEVMRQCAGHMISRYGVSLTSALGEALAGPLVPQPRGTAHLSS